MSGFVITQRALVQSTCLPACGRLGDEREGGAVFICVASLLSILTAVVYGNLLYSYRHEKQSNISFHLTIYIYDISQVVLEIKCRLHVKRSGVFDNYLVVSVKIKGVCRLVKCQDKCYPNLFKHSLD